MDRRLYVPQSQISDLGPDHTLSRQHSGPQMNLENGSSILPSNGVPNPSDVAYANTAVRMGNTPLSNYNPGAASYLANNAGNSYYSYMCPPSAASLNQLPPYYVQNGPCYNQVIVSDASVWTIPQVEYGRSTYKRKFPSASDIERGTSSGFYGAGSSSNHPFQAGYLGPKPVVDHGYWPVDPAGSEHSYRTNELFGSEDISHRNVRSRHSNVAYVGTTSSGVYSSHNMFQHFHPVVSTVYPTVPGQLTHNSVAHDPRAVGCSDNVSFNHGMHHPNGGSYGPNGSMGSSGGNWPNVYPTRTFSYQLPQPPDTSTQASAVVHCSSNQSAAYRIPLSNSSTGFTNNAQGVRVPTGDTAIASRHPRNMSVLWRGNEANGRPRNRYSRLPPFPDGGNAPARWAYEGVATVDQATFYAPLNFVDHHRNMRLDIDNMSYEELLALGDRIGNVSTGLSAEAMSTCLLEKIYSSSDVMQNDQEKESCVICLEVYEDSERIGRLRCRHEFHAICIRKWLSIKNVCPICKVSAFQDALKEKQTISV